MQLPEGYVPLAEVWPVWLSRRFPNTSKRLFDPERYRPNAMGGFWEIIGPDPITGEYRQEPEQRIKDFAETVPDYVAGETQYELGMIQEPFWKEFCKKNTGVDNAIIERDGEWQALHYHEWASLCENLLWRKVVAEDPNRTDWGPKKWMALAMGDKIPQYVAVHRQVFAENLAEGRHFSDFSISEIVAAQAGETTGQATEAPTLATGHDKENATSANFTEAEIGVVTAAQHLWAEGQPPAGMTATKRNMLITEEFRARTGGRAVSDRTIRAALSKAGLIHRGGAS